MTAPERDEDFEAYLQRRSALQREFSEPDGLEPPPELDRIVLARARQAITTRPEPPVYKPAKWAFPLALAATVVVSFTIVLSMTSADRKEVALSEPELAMDSGSGGRVLEREAGRARESDLRLDDLVAQAETAAAAPSGYAPPPPPPAAQKSTPDLPFEEPAEPAPVRLAAQAPPAASSTAETERAGAAEPEDAQLAQAEAPEVAEVRVDTSESSESAVSADESPRVAARQAPRSPPFATDNRSGLEEVTVTGAHARAPTRAERRANPDLWLAYIEDLRDRGRHSAADRELRAFRKQYPDYPVPPEAERAD